MPRTPAIFNGPVEVMDKNNGELLSLSATDVYFEDSQIKAKGNLYTANQALFDPFLAHLRATEIITAGPEPPTKPVMVIGAKTSGSKGNSVAVEFTNFDSGANPKFNAAVSETDTYPALKPDTIQEVLGSSATNGKQRGLVFLPGAAPGASALPKTGVYPMAVVAPATAATVDIPIDPGPGTAFKLQAKADGPDGALTQVEIKEVNAAALTFTLVATWKKSSAAKILPAAVGTTFDYEIDVSAPQGAAAVGTPTPGSVLLSGGADASDASKASAIVSG